MPDPPLCPTCHSKISVGTSRTQNGDGPDAGGNPVPAWSDDPVLTPGDNPTNGAAYEGFNYIYARNILELQVNRKQVESDLGITPPTEFTAVQADTFIMQISHLIELRISTERILKSIGMDLATYFTLDADGNVLPPGPTDTAKSDWTDVARGAAFVTQGLNSTILSAGNTLFKEDPLTDKAVPGTPADTTLTRGIHIEDLRHPIVAGVWLQYYWDTFVVPTNLSNYAIPQTDPTTVPPQPGSTNINHWNLTGSANVSSSGSVGAVNYTLAVSGHETGSATNVDMADSIAVTIAGCTYTTDAAQNFLNTNILLQGLYDNETFVDSKYYFKITPTSMIRLTYTTPSFGASSLDVACSQASTNIVETWQAGFPPPGFSPISIVFITNPPVVNTVTIKNNCTFEILVSFFPRDITYIGDGPFVVDLLYTTRVGGTSTIPASGTDLDIPIYSTLLAAHPTIVQYYNGVKGDKGIRLDSVEVIVNNTTSKSGAFPKSNGSTTIQPFDPLTNTAIIRQIDSVTIPSFAFSQTTEAVLYKIRVKQ